MALDSTDPLLTDLYVDDDEDYDVMTLMTSTAVTLAEGRGNTTRKMKCASIGEDVTQRITVVSCEALFSLSLPPGVQIQIQIQSTLLSQF